MTRLQFSGVCDRTFSSAEPIGLRARRQPWRGQVEGGPHEVGVCTYVVLSVFKLPGAMYMYLFSSATWLKR